MQQSVYCVANCNFEIICTILEGVGRSAPKPQQIVQTNWVFYVLSVLST
jgi:hypothetical protein